jgi:hypothetical protein
MQSYSYAGDDPVISADPTGLTPYGILYKKQCNGSNACINITKECEGINNHCGMYWQQEMKGVNWKGATRVDLHYEIQIGGATVASRWYGSDGIGFPAKYKTGKQPWHGKWGFDSAHDWGWYVYAELDGEEFTRYMLPGDSVYVSTYGTGWYDGTRHYHANWASFDVGEKVAWKGSMKWPRT